MKWSGGEEEVRKGGEGRKKIRRTRKRNEEERGIRANTALPGHALRGRFVRRAGAVEKRLCSGVGWC